MTGLREALRAAVPWLFEYGAHQNPRCHRGSDDPCYCGLDEAKKLVEKALQRVALQESTMSAEQFDESFPIGEEPWRDLRTIDQIYLFAEAYAAALRGSEAPQQPTPEFIEALERAAKRICVSLGRDDDYPAIDAFKQIIGEEIWAEAPHSGGPL